MYKPCTILVAASLCVGCVDYQFGRKNSTVSKIEDTGAPSWDTGDVEVEETCNGIDDNGNGLIDEGFPDVDEDGEADCTDKSCDVIFPAVGSAGLVDDCGSGGVISDEPWNLAIEWQWTGVSTDPLYRNVIVTPVIGNLTDDNGDGVINTDDTPDVVFLAALDGMGLITPAYLVVLDGETGAEHWVSIGITRGYVGFIQPSIIDVDGDGWPEILVSSDQGFALDLLDHEGNEIWSIEEGTAYYPVIADLEGDGDTEILYGDKIIDATTGNIERTIGTTAKYFPAIGDLDLDGSKDLIFADGVFSAAGSKLWGHPNSSTHHTYPIIVDTDGDPEGEVVMVTTGKFTIYDHDGTMLAEHDTFSSNRVWPPCAADFDGDGEVELAWADTFQFNVYELDGTRSWYAPIWDGSGGASCSAFDFDGDESYEVVYADEDDFWLFDGKTGTVLFNDPDHSSGTLMEYPTVADVDGDGSAEIISPSMYAIPFWGKTGGIGGITSYGHVDDQWANAGPSWSAHDFSESNYNPDSSVFGVLPPWQTHNLFQGRPTVGGLLFDLVAEITDVCVSACSPPGVVSAVVQAGNRGLVDTRRDVFITLYADNDGELTLIDEKIVPDGIPSGETVGGIEFVFPYEQYGTHGIVARVGEGWYESRDCILDNNSDAWTEPLCSE